MEILISTELAKENEELLTKNQVKRTGHENLKLFGRDKPAVAGPGRPKMPLLQKQERIKLQQMLKNIAPDAIRTVHAALDSEDEKNRLRASEIILTYSVPRLEEVELNDERPLEKLPDHDLDEILTRATAEDHPAGPGREGKTA